MDAFGMLVELGASGAAPHRSHLRHVEDQAFGDETHAVGFGQRDAGVEQHVDGEGAFIERRKERARKMECGHARCHHCQRRDHNECARMPECARKHRAVAALEDADQPAFMPGQALEAGKHVIGHHRRERDRDHKAGQDRDDVGLSERSEQPASMPESANSGTNTRTMIMVA